MILLQMDSTTRELEKAVDDTKSKAKVTDALVDDDLSPLSGKPYYHCLVTKSNIKPVYHMVVLIFIQMTELMHIKFLWVLSLSKLVLDP